MKSFGNRRIAFLEPTTIPVPIEEIIEFEFGMNIIPIPGLHQGYEIDGFISSDLSEISVDQFVYESRPGRYRFTLAHELGHAVLHRKVYEAAAFSTIKKWKRFIEEIDLQDYEWLEWQGYAFAGLILVPPAPLKKKFAEAVRHLPGDLGPSGARVSVDLRRRSFFYPILPILV